MSLEKKVRALVISEYPLDSIIGNSEQAKHARLGILEYVKREMPDLVFVDGLCSRIRYPEGYIKEMLALDHLETFLEGPFELASSFLNDIKGAYKEADVYMAFSDADWHNIRRLTHHIALKKMEADNEQVESYKNEIKNIDASIKEEKENKTRGWKERVETQRRKKGGLKTSLKRFTKKAMLRMPNAESTKWRECKEEAANIYFNRLCELNPGIHINREDIRLEKNGYSFWYSHNFHKDSDVSLKSRTNKLKEDIDSLYMGGVNLPDFIVESGHHGENVAYPYRHGLEDRYSLIVTAMVMEDQEVVNDIRDGRFAPQLFQGKTNKLEACKRQSKKKFPSPGITLVERNKEGFAVTLYSMDHLAKVGEKKIEAVDMSNPEEVEIINVLSDIHVGKGAVRYDKLEAALNKMVEELKERVITQKQSAPVLMMLNESLQGRNYKNMPVETIRSLPHELGGKMDRIIETGEKVTIDGKIYVDIETARKVKKEGVNELERTNEPRIMNQLKWYYKLTNRLVMATLLYCRQNPAVVFTEGTHILHTVGEYGITEAGLQALHYQLLSQSAEELVELGLLPEGTGLEGVCNKIHVCEDASGYTKFDLELEGHKYKVSAVHKPGSANPSSNIPLLHIRRAVTMADDADIHFAAHLHTPFFVSIGRQVSNAMSVFYKGATFNEYDDYGKSKGWSPAVVGYEQAIIPKKKEAKGVYKCNFITSDVL